MGGLGIQEIMSHTHLKGALTCESKALKMIFLPIMTWELLVSKLCKHKGLKKNKYSFQGLLLK